MIQLNQCFSNLSLFCSVDAQFVEMVPHTFLCTFFVNNFDDTGVLGEETQLVVAVTAI